MGENRKNFGRHRRMKAQTLTALLDGIASGCTSRRQLQSRTGFSWGSVSSYISLLEEAGAIEPIPPEPAAGRAGRTVRYRIAPRNFLCLGMELKPAAIETVLGTLDGRILVRRLFPAGGVLDNRNLEFLVRRAFAETAAAAGVTPERIGGVVFSVTGAADMRRLRWLRSPHNPGISDCDFGRFRDLLPENGILALEHDILSKARAVLNHLGNPPGVNLFLHVGDGIGMAVERDGAFFTGSRGFAGEIGHIPLYPPDSRNPERRPCSCGQFNCLETFLPGRSGELPIDQLETLLLQLGVTAVNLCDPDRLILGGETIESFLELHGEAFARNLRSRSWMAAPADFRTYRMAECVPALGALLGQRQALIRSIVSTLE